MRGNTAVLSLYFFVKQLIVKMFSVRRRNVLKYG